MNQSRMICPSCGQSTPITDIRAGRFRVGCPRCGSPLVLNVEVGDEISLTVELEALGETAPKPVSNPTSAPHLVPRTGGSGWLGRYRIRGGWNEVRAGVGAWGRWLGVGPTVDLARVRDRWATDARFVARWTLEAFASSQLHHPNLAGPFAVEVAGDRVFAATSLDDFAPLSDPARGRADLDRQGRVAAVLHAARGLRFAHEQGVFHRDLDLGSIRIDAEARVTVTGLGVGLVPESSVEAPVASISLSEPKALGLAQPPTPDARNDVVALGQVLSTLVAGARGDRAVPPGLAGIARRMVGEEIDDRERYRDMGAVVRAIEAELGVDAPWNPTEAEAEAFGSAVVAYQTAPLGSLRRWVEAGFFGIVFLIVLAMAASGRIGSMVGWVVFETLVGMAALGFSGFAARDRLKSRIAPALAVIGRRDLIALAVAGLVVLGALIGFHLLMTWIGWTVLAVGLAASYHFGLERPLEASRSEALMQLKALVRGWRGNGVDEAAIRRFVAGAGGKVWEELFSSLFGLEAVAPARAVWGKDLSGRARPRFAPVRAWILGRVDALIFARTLHQTRALLEPILERDLEARGIHVLTARRKSRRAAEAVVAVAGQYRRSLDGSVGLPLLEAFRKAVDHPEEFLLSPEIAEDAKPWRSGLLARFYFETLLGRRMRFLLGMTALAGALIWMEQNSLVSFGATQRLVKNVTLELDWPRAAYQVREIAERFQSRAASMIETPLESEGMSLAFLPFEVSRRFDGFALVASGLILLASVATRGMRIIPVVLVAAVVPLLPTLLDPTTPPLGTTFLAASALGLAILAFGIAWSRRGLESELG